MTFPLPSLRAQLGLVLLAGFVAAGAAVFLIREVLGNTEGLLVEEARRQTELAAEQLRAQLAERMEMAGDSPLALPEAGRDLSLRAICDTVLHGFPGLDGGYWLGREAGLAGQIRPVSDAEDDIAAICAEAARARSGRVEQAARGWDLRVTAAVPLGVSETPVVAWSMRRLTDVRNPGRFRSNINLALLAGTSLLAVAGTLAVAVRLRRQVNEITHGVRRLENDLTVRLARPSGEIGEIAEAINRMTAQRLSLESELRRKELLAGLGRLVAGVAHEVRNPLNNIQLTLELMLREAPPGIEKTIRQLSGEADRMEGIVQQLLSLARPDDAARAPCSLASLLDNVLSRLDPYAAQRRIGFEHEFEPGVPDVAIYAPQIEQVFINVIRNAIEAAPPDSMITIKLFRQQTEACVSVRDSGSGVTAADAGRVFEPFFSTKPRGVGLGLALSREMVEANGGDIQFQSSPEGTTVTVRLPIEERK
jgi:signal transduction histidine kinase